MSSTRKTLDAMSANLDESMGLRLIDLQPKLTPVATNMHGLALDPKSRFLTSGFWLAELDAIAAELKLRPRLNVLHRGMLRIFDAIASWFARSPLQS